MARGSLSAPTETASTPWPPGVVRAAEQACAALPGITVSLAHLSERWRAADEAPAYPIDVCFALALADGQPAAWALFSDGYRQPLSEAARRALGAGPDAQEATLEAWRRLYRDRADAHAPWSFTRFSGSRPLLDHAVAALTVDGVELDGARDATTLLAETLHSENVRRTRPELILNLPALLVLIFFALIVPVTVMILKQPTADRELLRRMQIDLLVTHGNFDTALDLLSRAPPEGMTALRPLWPALRAERLGRMRSARVEPGPLQIVGPRGVIDAVLPTLTFQCAGTQGNVLIRVVRAGTYEVAFERVVPVDRNQITLDVDLARGARYVAEARGLDGALGLDKATFSVLGEQDRIVIEKSIENAMRGLETRDAFPFFAFHVYRAHECYDAALTALSLLEQRFPDSTYPIEERALVLGDMGLVPQAIVTARALPPPPSDAAVENP
ncbi:MAG: hypothetical protein IPH13_09835 [Planctomycetes bacterium]|nr:hypothetical protein [Planctomycetota bacterium]MCC7171345.1 hypothetical protein [Planctomycetota bacterium]